MRCLTGFAIYMWLLVVSRSSDYWLGISPHETLIALVDVEVCLGIPSCGTRCVPLGSRGLILGRTGGGRHLWYPASVLPTAGKVSFDGKLVIRQVLCRIKTNRSHGVIWLTPRIYSTVCCSSLASGYK